jgi:hypothetical protein
MYPICKLYQDISTWTQTSISPIFSTLQQKVYDLFFKRVPIPTALPASLRVEISRFLPDNELATFLKTAKLIYGQKIEIFRGRDKLVSKLLKKAEYDISQLPPLFQTQEILRAIKRISFLGYYQLTNEKLVTIIQRCINLEYVDFREYDIDAALLQYVAMLQQLRSLLITPYVTAKGLQALAHHSTLLKLTLSHTNVTDEVFEYIKTFSQLQELCLDGCKQITSKGLKALAGHFHLLRLNLSHTDSTDEVFEYIETFSKLQELRLDGCEQITSKGLQALSGHSTLLRLNLSHTNITDEVFEYIKTFSQLQELDLGWCRNFTCKGLQEGLQALAGHSNLSRLNLSGTKILDKAFKYIMTLPQLKELNLTWCVQITSKGLQALSGHSTLLRLNLSNTNVTDEVFEYIKTFSQLQELRLDGCKQITSKGLQALSGHSTLLRLNLSHTNVTDEVFEYIKRLSQLQELHLDECEYITSKGLRALAGHSTLLRLNLSRTNVTDEVLEYIPKLPRLQELNLHGCEDL